MVKRTLRILNPKLFYQGLTHMALDVDGMLET